MPVPVLHYNRHLCMKTVRFICRAWIGLAPVLALSVSAFTAAVPVTPKHPTTNTYHGTTVVDDYLWL